jgi:hypothetical protein
VRLPPLVAAMGVVCAALLIAGCSSSASPAGPHDGGSGDAHGAIGDAGGVAQGGMDGDSGDGGGCVPYAAPPDSALLAPPAAFAKDVLPIFEHSCGLGSSCHGDPYVARLFLGCDSTVPGTTCTVVSPGPQVYQAIAGKPAVEDPSMPYVTAGDPSRSYLMHKVDGDQCTLESECAPGNSLVAGQPWPSCGLAMPQNLGLIDKGSRDTIRRWIAQGAAQD